MWRVSRAEATSIVAFAPVFTANDNGSIAIFGNNLMICPAERRRAARRSVRRQHEEQQHYNMVHLDQDGATFPTFSSSSAAGCAAG